LENKDLLPAMIILAVATPVLAVLLIVFARAGLVSMPPRSRLVILLLAGPLNLALWYLFNHYLDSTGHRSVFGILLAAVVFIAVGFGAGFLRARARSESAAFKHQNVKPHERD
jgi:uncharacterized membrane protein